MRPILCLAVVLALLSVASATTITYPTNFPHTLDGTIIWVKLISALTTTGPTQLDNLCQRWNVADGAAANLASARAVICNNARSTPITLAARNYWQTMSYGNRETEFVGNSGYTISPVEKPVWAYSAQLQKYVRIAPSPGKLFKNGVYLQTGVGPAGDQITASNNFGAFHDSSAVVGVLSSGSQLASAAVFNGCHDSGLAHATNTCQDWTSNAANQFGTNGNGNSVNFGFGATESTSLWFVSTNSGQCDQINRYVYCAWQPSGCNGVRDGDETGVDCGGSTRCISNGQLTGATSCSTAVGDPQITGIQGQDFQVHGMPDEFFNLVSSPSLQVNGRFVYLSSGECIDNSTVCWSHPGTYVDLVGVLVGNQKVKIVAGAARKGLKVFIDGKEIKPSEHVHKLKLGSVTLKNHKEVVLATHLLTVTFTNSDHFVNFGAHLHDHKLKVLGSPRLKLADGEQFHPEVPLHGLLGQTWRNVEYSSGLEYEGMIADYQIQDGNLFSTKFNFNKYHL